MPSVGPELPPHLAKRKRSPVDDGDGGSSPPVKIRAASPPKERRILGPAPPPAPLEERPSEAAAKSTNSSEEDSSSDDDNYGPSLPPPAGSMAAYETEAEAEAFRAEAAVTERAKAVKLQREEWMLVPPSDSDRGSRVDPTKLKNRKFASGKGAKAPAAKSGISAIWTETPEQKRQRLEDEVMGRKDVSSAANSRSKPQRDEAEAEEIAKRIREYNEKNRGQSLYDEHKKAIPKEKEDDPSKRAFDKEKDMALGSRIGHMQKKDMLKRAGDFGSRFEKGSFL